MKEPGPYKGPKVGQAAYDAATGLVGILQAVCHSDDLAFKHEMAGPRIAFLRPERGGQEWMTEAGNVRFPNEAKAHPVPDDF